MCDFSRVSAWFCDEKISLKKSCFYLYIRRRYEFCWNKTRGNEVCEKVYKRNESYDVSIKEYRLNQIEELVLFA